MSSPSMFRAERLALHYLHMNARVASARGASTSAASEARAIATEALSTRSTAASAAASAASPSFSRISETRNTMRDFRDFLRPRNAIDLYRDAQMSSLVRILERHAKGHRGPSNSSGSTSSTSFEDALKIVQADDSRALINMLNDGIELSVDPDDLPTGLGWNEETILSRREREELEALKDCPEGWDLEMYREMRARQLEAETWADEMKNRELEKLLEKADRYGHHAELPGGKRLMMHWGKDLTERFKNELAAIKTREKDENTMDRNVFGPYMLNFKPEELSSITINSVLSMMFVRKDKHNQVPGTLKLGALSIQIGKMLHAYHHEKKLKEKIFKMKRLNRDMAEVVVGGGAGREAGGVSVSGNNSNTTTTTTLTEGGESFVRGRLADEDRNQLRESERAIKNRYSTKNQGMYIINTHARRALRDDYHKWDSNVCAKIGVKCLKLLLDCATVDVLRLDEATGEELMAKEPAFYHTHQIDMGNPLVTKHRYGAIATHNNVLKILESGGSAVTPKFMPMVIPPMPWTKFNRGGLLTRRELVIRSKLKFQYREVMERCAEGQMADVYEALNALGSVRWRINTDILDVVDQLKERKVSVGVYPSWVDIEEPRLVERSWGLNGGKSVGLEGSMMIGWHGPDMSDRAVLRRALKRHEDAKRDLSSLRCDISYKHDIAKKLREEEVIYYPHTLDFRGRAYPMHPHLHHLGSDFCRGLLEFADAKPLGPNGLTWIKIQIANLYAREGVDKLSLEGRQAFIDSHLDDILDSAEEPMDGRRWWMKAEDPFQCLAACMEMRNALQSENPEEYLSRLPIHQDGSCNGLQHYAALGRDLNGARAVNMLPSRAPSDVYSEIAKEVSEKVALDAAAGVREALLLQDEVNRKLIKQTVMTSVYGVTLIGARQQIENRLKERGWPRDREMRRAAKYAADVTFSSMEKVFTSAQRIMKWLGDCADTVAKANKKMTWTTPLGLPVTQPYTLPRRKSVRTVLQSVVIIRDADEKSNVAKGRQRAAFPPNFIHSIDSSHMMMTASACKKRGIVFAGVHDSFWTHASTVEDMNDELRTQFILLHERPILEDFLSEIKDRFKSEVENGVVTFGEIPEKGELNLEVVKEAQYFFS